jgi:hypothetical protein
MVSVTEQLNNLAPPSGDGGDAMQEDYEADAEADDAAALEAKQAAENAARAQLAAAIPPAAQVVAGGAGFVSKKEGIFTVRTYTGGNVYAEVYDNAAGKCYLVGFIRDTPTYKVAYDEKTKVEIGKLDNDTALLSFNDDREPVTVSLSETQAAKPGEINSAIKIQQAVEKINKAAVKTEVRAGRDAELAGLDVQKAELEHENANIDKNAAAALHEEALVRLFPQSLAV